MSVSLASCIWRNVCSITYFQNVIFSTGICNHNCSSHKLVMNARTKNAEECLKTAGQAGTCGTVWIKIRSLRHPASTHNTNICSSRKYYKYKIRVIILYKLSKDTFRIAKQLLVSRTQFDKCINGISVLEHLTQEPKMEHYVAWTFENWIPHTIVI